MHSSDNLMCIFQADLLSKEEGRIVWSAKKLVLTSEKLLIFPPNAKEQRNEKDVLANNIFNFEIGQIFGLEFIEARIVDKEINANSKLDLTGVPKKNAYCKIVQVIDHANRKVKLLTLQNMAEAEKFVLATKAIRLYLLYKGFIKKEVQLPLNVTLQQWIFGTIYYGQNHVLKLEQGDLFPDYLQNNQEKQENLQMMLSYFFKNNTLIRKIQLNQLWLDLSDDSMNVLRLTIISIPLFQLQSLAIVNSEITLDQLKYLLPALVCHSNLQELSFQNNRLSDDSFPLLSQIFQQSSFLTKLDLSYNEIRGTPAYFQPFLDSAVQYLSELKLDLKANLIDDAAADVLENVFFYAECPFKEMDLSLNKFSRHGFWKVFMSYHVCPHVLTFVLQLKPIPFHPNYIHSLFRQEQAQFNLTLTRETFSTSTKPPPTTLAAQRQVMLFSEELSKLQLNCKKAQNQMSLEYLSGLSQQIGLLEFEFPARKLDYLYDVLWDAIHSAIKSQDHYAIRLLVPACASVGLDISSLKSQLMDLMQKAEKLNLQLLSLLNFEFDVDSNESQQSEAQYNLSLDQALTSAYKLDLRNYLVDTLTCVKEVRDKWVMKRLEEANKTHMGGLQYVQAFLDNDEDIEEENSKYLQDEDDLNKLYSDPYMYLNENMQFVEPSLLSSEFLEDAQCTPNLMLHPLKIDYLEVSRMNQEQIEVNLQESKFLLSDESDSYLNDELERYAIENVYARCLFLKTDFAQYLRQDELAWRLVRGDLIFNCARLTVQFYQYNSRLELTRTHIIQSNSNIFKKPYRLRYCTNSEEHMDAEQQSLYLAKYDMNKYPGLKSLEQYLQQTKSFKSSVQHQKYIQGLSLKRPEKAILSTFQKVGVGMGKLFLKSTKIGVGTLHKLGMLGVHSVSKVGRLALNTTKQVGMYTFKGVKSIVQHSNSASNKETYLQEEMRKIAQALQESVAVREHKVNNKMQPKCFIGAEVVRALLDTKRVTTELEALEIGSLLLKYKYAVLLDQDQKNNQDKKNNQNPNSNLVFHKDAFYRFAKHGNVQEQKISSALFYEPDNLMCVALKKTSFRNFNEEARAINEFIRKMVPLVNLNLNNLNMNENFAQIQNQQQQLNMKQIELTGHIKEFIQYLQQSRSKPAEYEGIYIEVEVGVKLKNAVIDEAYLQLYKLVNTVECKLDLVDSVFKQVKGGLSNIGNIIHIQQQGSDLNNKHKDRVSRAKRMTLTLQLLSLMTLYTPPGPNLFDYVHAWVRSIIAEQQPNSLNNNELLAQAQKQTVQTQQEQFLQSQNDNIEHQISSTSNINLHINLQQIALRNLNNLKQEAFMTPEWPPSLLEVHQMLYQAEWDKLQISFFTYEQGQYVAHSLVIGHFDTVKDLMQQIQQDSDLFNMHPDKFMFWLYSGVASKEDDLALPAEALLLQVLSHLDTVNKSMLLVKRRVFCTNLTLNIPQLDDVQLDSLFSHIQRDYLVKDRFSGICKMELLTDIAAILYLLSIFERNSIQLDLKGQPSSQFNYNNFDSDMSPSYIQQDYSNFLDDDMNDNESVNNTSVSGSILTKEEDLEETQIKGEAQQIQQTQQTQPLDNEDQQQRKTLLNSSRMTEQNLEAIKEEEDALYDEEEIKSISKKRRKGISSNNVIDIRKLKENQKDKLKTKKTTTFKDEAAVTDKGKPLSQQEPPQQPQTLTNLKSAMQTKQMQSINDQSYSQQQLLQQEQQRVLLPYSNAAILQHLKLILPKSLVQISQTEQFANGVRQKIERNKKILDTVLNTDEDTFNAHFEIMTENWTSPQQDKPHQHHHHPFSGYKLLDTHFPAYPRSKQLEQLKLWRLRTQHAKEEATSLDLFQRSSEQVIDMQQEDQNAQKEKSDNDEQLNGNNDLNSNKNLNECESNLEKKLLQIKMRLLKERMLIRLANFHLFTGSAFHGFHQDLSEKEGFKKEVYIVVNAFGIFVFNSATRDYPLKAILYQEILYMVGLPDKVELLYLISSSSSNISQMQQQQESKLELEVSNKRGRELHEDAVAYAQIRMHEKQHLLYAINSLDEFTYRVFHPDTLKKQLQKKHLAKHLAHDSSDEEEEQARVKLEQQHLHTVEQEIYANNLVVIEKPNLSFHCSVWPLYRAEETRFDALKRIRHINGCEDDLKKTHLHQELEENEQEGSQKQQQSQQVDNLEPNEQDQSLSPSDNNTHSVDDNDDLSEKEDESGNKIQFKSQNQKKSKKQHRRELSNPNALSRQNSNTSVSMIPKNLQKRGTRANLLSEIEAFGKKFTKAGKGIKDFFLSTNKNKKDKNSNNDDDINTNKANNNPAQQKRMSRGKQFLKKINIFNKDKKKSTDKKKQKDQKIQDMNEFKNQKPKIDNTKDQNDDNFQIFSNDYNNENQQQNSHTFISKQTAKASNIYSDINNNLQSEQQNIDQKQELQDQMADYSQFVPILEPLQFANKQQNNLDQNAQQIEQQVASDQLNSINQIEKPHIIENDTLQPMQKMQENVQNKREVTIQVSIIPIIANTIIDEQSEIKQDKTIDEKQIQQNLEQMVIKEEEITQQNIIEQSSTKQNSNTPLAHAETQINTEVVVKNLKLNIGKALSKFPAQFMKQENKTVSLMNKNLGKALKAFPQKFSKGPPQPLFVNTTSSANQQMQQGTRNSLQKPLHPQEEEHSTEGGGGGGFTFQGQDVKDIELVGLSQNQASSNVNQNFQQQLQNIEVNINSNANEQSQPQPQPQQTDRLTLNSMESNSDQSPERKAQNPFNMMQQLMNKKNTNPSQQSSNNAITKESQMVMPPKSEFQMLREKMIQASKLKEEKKAQQRIDIKTNKRTNEEGSTNVSFIKNDTVSQQNNQNTQQTTPKSQAKLLMTLNRGSSYIDEAITTRPKQSGPGDLHLLSQLTSHDKVVSAKQVLPTLENARSIFSQSFQPESVQKSALLKLKSRDSTQIEEGIVSIQSEAPQVNNKLSPFRKKSIESNASKFSKANSIETKKSIISKQENIQARGLQKQNLKVPNFGNLQKQSPSKDDATANKSIKESDGGNGKTPVLGIQQRNSQVSLKGEQLPGQIFKNRANRIKHDDQ